MNVPMNLKDEPDGKVIPIGFAAVGVTGNSVPKNLTHNGDLIPREMKRDLHGKIKTAIKDLGLKSKYNSIVFYLKCKVLKKLPLYLTPAVRKIT